jgi:hypothetical protein
MDRSLRSGALLAVALGGGLIGGIAGGLWACGKPAQAPDHTGEVATTATETEVHRDAGVAAADAEAPQKDDCSGYDIDEVSRLLEKSACEMPPDAKEPKAMPVKDRLDIKVQTSAPKVASGQHVDILVTFTNKLKTPQALYFTVDPLPRFEIEAYDAKTKRVDMPAGQPPPLPEGVPPRVPGEAKTARVTLAPSGSARLHLGWDAVKTKWAPDKVRGTPPEKGYPRVPAGGLPKGKYTLKVVMPMLGIEEGGEHNVTSPKVPIEVTAK